MGQEASVLRWHVAAGVLAARGLGVGGLTLADLLRHEARGNNSGRPKSVIYVVLNGGPSHIDSHFTIDLSDFHEGKGILEVPRWFGSNAENQLGP